MKKFVSLFAVLTAALLLSAEEQTAAETSKLSVAETPIAGFADKSKDRKWWEGRFKRHVLTQAQKKGDKIQLLFLGDSITHFLESGKKYKPIWNEFSYCNALNAGFSGDLTQHTLWIVEESGLLDLIHPKVIILLIGTNNNSWQKEFQYPAAETARAIIRIVRSLRKKQPQAKIVLFGIFPRGEKPGTRYRTVNDEVNREISKLANGENVFYENINDKFLREDGTLPKSLFPDLLHPNEDGYRIWMDAVRPYVYKYIGKPETTAETAEKE